MSEMTEEEARRLLKEDMEITPPLTCHHPYDQGRFNGYLERVSQEKETFGPLVKSLNHVLDHSFGIAECPKNPVACVKEVLEKFYEENPSWRK